MAETGFWAVQAKMSAVPLSSLVQHFPATSSSPHCHPASVTSLTFHLPPPFPRSPTRKLTKHPLQMQMCIGWVPGFLLPTKNRYLPLPQASLNSNQNRYRRRHQLPQSRNPSQNWPRRTLRRRCDNSKKRLPITKSRSRRRS